MTSLAVVARGRVYELVTSKFQNKSKPFAERFVLDFKIFI